MPAQHEEKFAVVLAAGIVEAKLGGGARRCAGWKRKQVPRFTRNDRCTGLRDGVARVEEEFVEAVAKLRPKAEEQVLA